MNFGCGLVKLRGGGLEIRIGQVVNNDVRKRFLILLSDAFVSVKLVLLQVDCNFSH